MGTILRMESVEFFQVFTRRKNTVEEKIVIGEKNMQANTMTQRSNMRGKDTYV